MTSQLVICKIYLNDYKSGTRWDITKRLRPIVLDFDVLLYEKITIFLSYTFSGIFKSFNCCGTPRQKIITTFQAMTVNHIFIHKFRQAFISYSHFLLVFPVRTDTLCKIIILWKFDPFICFHTNSISPFAGSFWNKACCLYLRLTNKHSLSVIYSDIFPCENIFLAFFGNKHPYGHVTMLLLPH